MIWLIIYIDRCELVLNRCFDWWILELWKTGYFWVIVWLIQDFDIFQDSSNSLVICDTELQELLGCESIPTPGIRDALARNHLFPRAWCNLVSASYCFKYNIILFTSCTICSLSSNLIITFGHGVSTCNSTRSLGFIRKLWVMYNGTIRALEERGSHGFSLDIW